MRIIMLLNYSAHKDEKLKIIFKTIYPNKMLINQFD